MNKLPDGGQRAHYRKSTTTTIPPPMSQVHSYGYVPLLGLRGARGAHTRLANGKNENPTKFLKKVAQPVGTSCRLNMGGAGPTLLPNTHSPLPSTPPPLPCHPFYGRRTRLRSVGKVSLEKLGLDFHNPILLLDFFPPTPFASSALPHLSERVPSPRSAGFLHPLSSLQKPANFHFHPPFTLNPSSESTYP